MIGHTHSAQVGRLEVVGVRRRRRSEEEKLRIVTESLSGPRLVSATARRHGISRSLLVKWRRAYVGFILAEKLGEDEKSLRDLQINIDVRKRPAHSVPAVLTAC